VNTKMLRQTSMLLVVALVCMAVPAMSQTLTGNITARAQDSTAAVIPGVDVTVSSPSMIGGSRNAVTDETGSYRFTLLPPGTYRVTFALPGFKTLNIDGVTVTAGNTATQIGVMEVASTAEEITVSSQAPTIDLESATVGVNISQKMMDELPWSRSLRGMSMMIPGVRSTSFDIGNSSFGTSSTIAATSGGRSGGNVVTIDGLIWCQTYSDYGSFEEMNVSTNAKGADQMNSGITLGMVVKSGGNQFHGNATAKYQNGSFQSNNISQDLLDRGYPVGSNKYTHFTDYYADIGGPILKDKFWFYGAYRRGYQGQFIPGFRTAVGGAQTDFWTLLLSYSAKLTYQLTNTQKLEAYVGLPDKHQPYRGANALNPKESTQDQDSWSSQGPMLTYTNIINSKTTLTGKISRGGYWWPAYTYGFNGPEFEGLGPNVAQLVNGSLVMKRIPTLQWLGVQNVGVRVNDTTTGATDGGYNSNYSRPIRWQENIDLSRFATIGGKNNELKFGYQGWWDKSYSLSFGYPYAEQYQYRSLSTETCPNSEICSNYFQHPYRVVVYDYPSHSSNGGLYRSAYGNDKITVNRKLTLNLGLRYDWATTFLPPQGNDGSGPYARKFTIDQKQHYYLNADGSKSEFPTYNLWSPRLSFAYDLFGNGKVAVKGSYGRYVGITSSPNSQPGPGVQNPISTTSCTYTNWDGSIPFDAKQNFGPDGIMGTADDIALNGSCAKTTVVNGQTVPLNTYHWDSNLKASYVNEYTGTVDLGLSRDYSVHFSIQRKFDRNGSQTVNLNRPYELYTALKCAHDPGADGVLSIVNGGKTTLGNGAANNSSDDDPFGLACAYTIPSTPEGNAAFNAATNTLYRATDGSTHEGNNSYTGYTMTFNKNYSNRWQMVASLNIDMSHSVNSSPLNPNDVISQGLSARGNVTWHQSFKMSGVYAVPDIPLFVKSFKLAGVQYASTFLSQDGGWYSRSATVRDARGSNVSITMDPRFGKYPWLNDWDQSIRKKFKLGESGQTLEFTWELYNSTNAATIQSWRSTSTASSLYLQPDKVTPLRPSSILAPRIYEWGVTWKF
jgi:Carboxypeptidase regulatory-like domain